MYDIKTICSFPKVSDLIGTIIECRNGTRYFVSRQGNNDAIYGIKKDSSITISGNYYSDLTYLCNDDYDIMRVLKPSQTTFPIKLSDAKVVMWKRKEKENKIPENEHDNNEQDLYNYYFSNKRCEKECDKNVKLYDVPVREIITYIALGWI